MDSEPFKRLLEELLAWASDDVDAQKRFEAFKDELTRKFAYLAHSEGGPLPDSANNVQTD